MNENPYPDAAQETCIKCGAPVNPSDQFCDSCGAKIETSPSCKKCGAQLGPDAQFCDTCGAQIGEGKMAVQSEPSNQKQMPTILPDIIQQESPDSLSTQRKSPGLAFIASLFIPGLGQIYNGNTAKGFAIFFGSLIGSFIFLIPGLIVWIYGMVDAYSTANNMNIGKIPFVTHKKVYMIILIIIWLAIVAIFLLFLYYIFMVFIPVYTGTTGTGTTGTGTTGTGTTGTGTTSAKDWNEKGRTFYIEGNFQDALDAYNKALSIDPNYEIAWNSKGVALGSLGKYQDALDAFDKALSIDPNMEQAWNNKGVTFKNLGEYQNAVDAYNKALSIDPNFEQAWNNKGSVLEKLGRQQEAQDAYNKASLIHSKNLVSTTPTPTKSQQSAGQSSSQSSSQSLTTGGITGVYKGSGNVYEWKNKDKVHPIYSSYVVAVASMVANLKQSGNIVSGTIDMGEGGFSITYRVKGTVTDWGGKKKITLTEIDPQYPAYCPPDIWEFDILDANTLSGTYFDEVCEPHVLSGGLLDTTPWGIISYPNSIILKR